jgi:hypothetical protein
MVVFVCVGLEPRYVAPFLVLVLLGLFPGREYFSRTQRMLPNDLPSRRWLLPPL